MEKFSSILDRSGTFAGRAVPNSLLRILKRTSPGPFSLRLFITLPILGLFMEWLLPLQGMGGDNGPVMLQTLAILAALLLMQGLFVIRGWVWFPLNVCAVLLLWGRLFGSEHALFWLLRYIVDVLPQDVNVLGERWLFNDLSDETKALILLLGWGVMVSAVHMLSLYRGTVWLFGGTTIVYLAVMEAALEHPVIDNMFRSVCYILVAQGLMLLLNLRTEESADSRIRGTAFKLDIKALIRWSLYVLFLTASLTGLVGALGYIVPASKGSGVTVSALADKIQEWSSGLSNRNAIPTASMTGYDSLGSEMGGPLTLSNEPYFTAETPVPTYWRGEALSYYDGRRWITERHDGSHVDIGEKLQDMLLDAGDQTDQVTQRIILESPPSAGLPLFSGGTIARISEVNGLDGTKLEPMISADPKSGTLRFQEEDLRVMGYTVDSTLQASKEKLQEASFGVDPESIKSTYLQLPASLPRRVRDMAHDITTQATGRYEKAVAVKNYLEQEYSYTLKTKIPPANKDFTDHFLFDSKEGYCTHFATAMVVLLRSQGIPARYVMGFAPGEKVQGTENIFRVTQQEAHAWVEVYFPGEGWAAFDPTPGYYAGEDEVSNAGISTGQSSSNSLRFTEMMQTLMTSAQRWFTGVSLTRVALLSLILLLGVMAVIMIKPLRGLNLRSSGASRVMNERDKLTFISDKVWKCIEKRYGAMEPGVTVKKYIQSVSISDDNFRAELEVFASRWEKVAYMKEPLSRTEKNLYIRQCREIVKNRV